MTGFTHSADGAFCMDENECASHHVCQHGRCINTDGGFRYTSYCGLYYKCFMIVIYNRNDSGQYYKTRITIIIDDPI